MTTTLPKEEGAWLETNYLLKNRANRQALIHSIK